LKIKDALTVFFVIYIVGLSFVPLIHQTLLSKNAWLGYGTGAYALQSQRYFILFNDPYDGSSKPNIHINPYFAPNARISLLEFSDWTSWVNGFNLFNDFNVTMRGNQEILDVTYMRPGITLHKFIQVSPDGNGVIVKLVANKELTAHLELWKWVMSSVNGISASKVSKPIVIPTGTVINYTFWYRALNAVGNGSILLSRNPTQIEVWPFEDGFNKITVDFINSEMSLTVSGSMSTATTPPFIWDYSDLPYVLPVVAILVIAVYLLVAWHGKQKKSRSRSSRS